MIRRFGEASLVVRFVTAGGAVMLVAMLATGSWVTARIQQSVVDSSASAAALLVESLVSPLTQELADGELLSEQAIRALDEVFASTSIGDRIVSFRLWKDDGLIVYASNRDMVGARFAESPELSRAWSGAVTATFGGLDDAESAAEAELGLPLLEVYSPVRQVWSGEVIAVAEFYEVATALSDDLADARRGSWLLVSGAFLTSGLLLFGIVRAGGRTIERQKSQLRAQVAESRDFARQNADLRLRAIGAASRATAQAEKDLRRVSADLHDGPAQYVALATMRLDAIVPDTPGAKDEAASVRRALQAALSEIRSISRGLSLPDLERLGLEEVARRAVEAHAAPDGTGIAIDFEGTAGRAVGDSVKICVYRFLQEALSNAARHAEGADVAVRIAIAGATLTASVADQGPGFDPATPRGVGPDGGQGLKGLRDRAESLGGALEIDSTPGRGTRLTLMLPIEAGETP
jgi:signal transduction histidine kinase